MENRIPAIGQAGRCLVTPEDTSLPPFHAVITMDDNPTQEGTPLIKETLFDDENEELYSLSGYDANPNNAFKKAHSRLEFADGEIVRLDERVDVEAARINTRPLQVWEFVAANATWVPPYVGRYRFYVVGGGGGGGAGAHLGAAGTGNGGVGGGGGGGGLAISEFYFDHVRWTSAITFVNTANPFALDGATNPANFNRLTLTDVLSGDIHIMTAFSGMTGQAGNAVAGNIGHGGNGGFAEGGNIANHCGQGGEAGWNQLNAVITYGNNGQGGDGVGRGGFTLVETEYGISGAGRESAINHISIGGVNMNTGQTSPFHHGGGGGCLKIPELNWMGSVARGAILTTAVSTGGAGVTGGGGGQGGAAWVTAAATGVGAGGAGIVLIFYMGR